MSRSRNALLAVCIVASAFVAGGASAQQDKGEKSLDLKPFLPPVLPLPPNAQVTPDTLNQTTTPSDTTQTQTTPAGGLKITIPTR